MTFALLANTPIEFSADEASEAALFQGWALPERGLVWSDGTSAVLRFSLNRLQHGSTIVLRASPHLSTDLVAQRLSIFGNGLYMGSYFLDGSGMIVVPVPTFVCLSVVVSGRLDLAFDIPDCRPGSGGDRRLLGLALHSLELRTD